jgi:hypothetical protein
MSKEIVEIVRRANATPNCGDLDGELEMSDSQGAYYRLSGTPLDTAELLRGLDKCADR